MLSVHRLEQPLIMRRVRSRFVASWLKGNTSPSFPPRKKRLTNETIHELLANDPSLTCLEVINDDDLRQSEPMKQRLLLALKHNITVHAVLLMGIELNESNVKLLGSVIRRKKSIKKLLLPENFISDIGTRALARVLDTSCAYACTSIRVLDLSDNFIGDEGAKELARLLEGTATSETCRLRKLNLQDNRIGSAGAMCLARALPRASRHLRILNLNNNCIGEEAAREVITCLSTLRYVIQVTIAGDNNQVHQDTEKTLVQICRLIRKKVRVKKRAKEVELQLLEQSRGRCLRLCLGDAAGGRRTLSQSTFGAIEAPNSFPELEESIRIDRCREEVLNHRGSEDYAEATDRYEDKNLVDDRQLPDEIFCSITVEIMNDPVVACDGFTYERNAIESWFKNFTLEEEPTSPTTNTRLASRTLIPNHSLRSLCHRYKQKTGLLFGNESSSSERNEGNGIQERGKLGFSIPLSK